MKLLILTQKVNKNDPILGFFHRWILEFACACEEVTVICLEEGLHDLPDNVRIFSLGKEGGASRAMYVRRFYSLIWKERKHYDAVFVHMNPEYVVLGGLVWKLLGKRIGLWYTHREVNLKLRTAERLADVIFSSSKESFQLPSSKVRFLGHGIDVEALKPVPPLDFLSPLVGMHIGRITEIKHLDTILQSIQRVLVMGIPLRSFRLVGVPVTEADLRYQEHIESLVRDLGLEGVVIFEGFRPNAVALAETSFTVNAAPDGGMDKAVLESLAAGRPVFASNKAFEPVFGAYARTFLYPFGDYETLAEHIKGFLENPDKERMLGELSERVRNTYDVPVLIGRIIAMLHE